MHSELFPLKDPFASSFWAFCHVQKFSIDESKFKEEKIKISPNQFISKSYDLKLNLQKKIAPLAIVMPGSLTNTSSKQATNLAYYLLNQGHHVLRLPNPIGTEYISLHPKHEIGDVFSEAESYIEIIKQVIDHLSKKNILTEHKVYIVSVSYGAFLAAIINSTHPNLIRRSIRFVPPVNLRQSLRSLHKVI